MAGLIPMPIIPFREQCVEHLHSLPVTAEALEQTLYIMRDIPCIMAGGAFCYERHAPCLLLTHRPPSVGMPSVGVVRLGVYHILPVGGASHQRRIVIIIPKGLCHLRDSEVIKRILKSARCLLLLMVGIGHSILKRHISILEVRGERTPPLTVCIVGMGLGREEGVLAHIMVSLLPIKMVYTFNPCIGERDRDMVAYHRGGIAVPAWEDGEPSALTGHIDKRLHHPARQPRGYDIEKGMERTVCVPHGEVAIGHSMDGGADYCRICIGETWTRAVDIACLTRKERCAVHGTIELPDARCAAILNIYRVEAAAP